MTTNFHFLAITHPSDRLNPEGDTSRATSTDGDEKFSHAEGRKTPQPHATGENVPVRRGRKPVATPERLAAICTRLADGETERGACLAEGLGWTTWNMVKRCAPALRARVEAARQERARRRHARYQAARLESQWARGAGRQVVKPRPTYQANLVFWHLVKRVSLEHAAIPSAEITAACACFGLSVESWTRQEAAFGLMKKVYERRARVRGEQSMTPVPMQTPFMNTFEDWPTEPRSEIDDLRARYSP